MHDRFGQKQRIYSDMDRPLTHENAKVIVSNLHFGISQEDLHVRERHFPS
jgi:hypothetical protein